MLDKLPFASRLVLAFVLMTMMVSAMFSLGIYGTVLFVEEHLISKELGEELKVILEKDIKAGFTPRLDPRTRFLASDSKEHPLPEHYKLLPEGFTEVVEDNEAVYVFLREINGVRYALIQEQNEFEAREQVLFNATLAGFILCIAGSWLLGSFMAKRVMKPIRRLAMQVRTIGSAHPPCLLAPGYAQDEIGNLAQAFDSAIMLLRQSLEREQLFTSDVSHELRTPLMVIASSCELLHESALDQEQLTQLECIQRSVADMHDLVQTFLLLARNRQKDAAFDDNITLDQAVLMQAACWSERIRDKGLEFAIVSEATDDGQYNKTLLTAVLSNLLRNALHYTETGGVRVVQTHGGFRVEDSGMGIPESARVHVFEPFVRGTATRGEGLGLGLSLVKRICTHQGWDIRISSMPGGGTCFTVSFDSMNEKDLFV